MSHLDISYEFCQQCIGHQGPSKELQRAQKHNAMLRERLDAARDGATKAYSEREQARQKMRFAYRSRDRAVEYLSKINNLHQLRGNGACSCGAKQNCRTAGLLYESWSQDMIRRYDEALAERERQIQEFGYPLDDWD